ncbi:MAG: metallophosphoesterase [Cephaloticoccus sp.]|nr:metallophosphoesterase [Cephaloticoccus sp.]MCF7759670.1 metallophosphoesterase [Cephaloticoccus sp.]
MSLVPAGRIRFVVLQDFHHRDERCDPWMEALFRQVAQTAGADFCFCLGDLADAGKRESLETMARLAKSSGLPLYFTPGNHDLDLSPVDGWFEAVFPGRRNYTFTIKGWQFVVIDTTEGAKYEEVMIARDTLNWLDETIPGLDHDAPTVVATHFPLASEVEFCPRNAQQVLDRLTGLNVRTIFSGHYHGRTSHWRGTIELVTNVCVSRVRKNHDDSPTKGYWVVDGTPAGQLTRTFVPFAGTA